MKKAEKEKINYKVFTIRLNDKTVELLKKKKIESGLSWNLFVYQMIKDDK